MIQEKSGLQALDPKLVAEIKRLRIVTRRSLNCEVLGQYRSAFRGQGLQFADLRPYVPGDDVKHIHWKATARASQVYVKSFEEERQAKILLCVDCSASTLQGAKKNQQQRALEFAALVTLLASRQGDATGLCLFSDEIELFLPARTQRSQQHAILRELSQSRRAKPQTDLAKSLRSLRSRLHGRHILFIISDFYTPKFDDELKMLALRHDVILVHLEDGFESQVPKVGLAIFSDLESGEIIEVDLGSARVRNEIRLVYQKRAAELKKLAQNIGVDTMRLGSKPVEALATLMRQRIAKSYTRGR
jgi:uncharacterized protein (DUF58 family)